MSQRGDRRVQIMKRKQVLTAVIHLARPAHRQPPLLRVRLDPRQLPLVNLPKLDPPAPPREVRRHVKRAGGAPDPLKLEAGDLVVAEEVGGLAEEEEGARQGEEPAGGSPDVGGEREVAGGGAEDRGVAAGEGVVLLVGGVDVL